VQHAEIARVRETSGHVALVTESSSGADAVIVMAHPLAWDTTFFGVPMAKIDVVLREEGTSSRVVDEAIGVTLARLRAAGIMHVSARIDVADLELVATLEAHGFRLMDCIVMYITHPKRRAPGQVRAVGHVRPFAPSDVDEIIEITRESYRGYRGRFQLDPHLPRERTDAFYVEWARQCVAGHMADRIYVADNGKGGLWGWSSVRLVEPVSSIGGIPVIAGSLGACRLDRPGAYGGLIGMAARDTHAAGAVNEVPTQNHNFTMVRLLEALSGEYARAEYTFHAWLG
jgi:hypothetical protein